jgi:hypothetical protein
MAAAQNIAGLYEPESAVLGYRRKIDDVKASSFCALPLPPVPPDPEEVDAFRSQILAPFHIYDISVIDPEYLGVHERVPLRNRRR